MQDIDFLPADYVCLDTTLSSNRWLCAWLVTVATLIATSWVTLTCVTNQLVSRRNEGHRQSRELHAKLSWSQTRLQEMAVVAHEERLIDVLRLQASPSRWLSAIGDAMPPQVSLRVIGSAINGEPETKSRSRPLAASSIDFMEHSPLEQDLERLARLAKQRSQVITLRGAAADEQAIAGFITGLQRTGLFERVELLVAYRTQQRDGTPCEFAIQLRVSPIPDRLNRPGPARTDPENSTVAHANQP